MSETYDLYQQGRAHLKKGRAAQATVALEKAKRREPQKASIREALGIAYLRIQRYEEAEAEFRVMLELSPDDHCPLRARARPREAGQASGGERPLQAGELPAPAKRALRVAHPRPRPRRGRAGHLRVNRRRFGLAASVPGTEFKSRLERSGWWVNHPHPGGAARASTSNGSHDPRTGRRASAGESGGAR